MALMRTEGVTKHFGGEQSLWDTILRHEPKPVRAVDGVTLDIHEGEIVGIAGESGCGKTTLGKLLVGLYEPTDGEIYFEGQPYSSITPQEEKQFRQRVQMIFQDPHGSLNPRFTVFDTVSEPLKINDMADSYEDREARVMRALEEAGLSPAEEYLDHFPKELSGGEQQRVAIARALVVDPDFIVADEPVSMLDVSIRASVLNLMRRLRDEHDLTYVFISHDLALIRYMCDTTGIMYLGDIVEFGDTEKIITDPRHPYTEALIDAVPVPDPTTGRERARIQGEVPSPEDPPQACKFHPRCPYARQICAEVTPDEYETEDGRFSKCYRSAGEHHEYWVSPELTEVKQEARPP